MKKNWWKEAVVYQVYPRSFMDTDGDGNGDIKGIISKLDYLEELGVTAIWISPFFSSPMIDNGYDISDYININPMFGTMKDFEELVEKANEKGIALINDAVLNHCSDKHKWFIESKKSRENNYSDYFIWRDKPVEKEGLDSVFSSSPWTYVKERKQYYFHAFSVEQPDLNWSNPEVRKEMAKTIKFWVNKGVKGFRFDVLDNIGKDIDNGIMNSGPNLHPYIKELRKEGWGDRDLLTVAESWAANEDNALLYTGSDREELAMVFQFGHIVIGKRNSLLTLEKHSVPDIKRNLYEWQRIIREDGWNSNFIQNHDLNRVVSAWGNDKEYWYESATALAMVNHLLMGTPYIYQGEEIGMTNNYFESIDDFNDVQTLEKYREHVLDKKTVSEEQYLAAQNFHGRDNARTPMQWNSEKNAGFSKAEKTWLKTNPNYRRINVDVQLNDSNSILSFYKNLISLRKGLLKDIVIYGKFTENPASDNVFSFNRELDGRKLTTISNWSKDRLVLKTKIEGEVILSNYKKLGHVAMTELEPFEAILIEVKK